VDDVGTTPPTRLRVSPSTSTVVVGASRGFSVRDDLGRIPPGVTWSVDTEGVVSLEPAAGGVTVVAQAAGVVHVTASWQGLTADAEVTVLATVGRNQSSLSTCRSASRRQLRITDLLE
jgi:hypothetical protein